MMSGALEELTREAKIVSAASTVLQWACSTLNVDVARI